MEGRRTTRESGRIPSLDGLRAVAITLMCANHFVNAFGGSQPPIFASAAEIGELGIHIFFVLSGFLITSLLLQEMRRTGTVNLGRFYFRRCLRIFPAFYVFVLAVAVGGSFGLWRYDHLVNAITYTADYQEPGWTLGHSWSLAVEEQFYLLWPLVLVCFGRRRAVVAALICLVLCPPLRTAMFLTVLHSYLLFHQFQAQMDALATGCLLAALREWLNSQAPYRRTLDHRAFFCVPLSVILAAELQVLHPFPYVQTLSALLLFTIINIGIALTMDWCLLHASGTVSRFLNAPLVAQVGVMSYSIYLWQEIIFMPSSDRLVSSPWITAFIGVSGIIASFYLIERPFLRLRRRLDPTLFSRTKPAPEAQISAIETPL